MPLFALVKLAKQTSYLLSMFSSKPITIKGYALSEVVFFKTLADAKKECEKNIPALTNAVLECEINDKKENEVVSITLLHTIQDIQQASLKSESKINKKVKKIVDVSNGCNGNVISDRVIEYDDDDSFDDVTLLFSWQKESITQCVNHKILEEINRQWQSSPTNPHNDDGWIQINFTNGT